jgi:hypothetical protein
MTAKMLYPDASYVQQYRNRKRRAIRQKPPEVDSKQEEKCNEYGKYSVAHLIAAQRLR